MASQRTSSFVYGSDGNIYTITGGQNGLSSIVQLVGMPAAAAESSVSYRHPRLNDLSVKDAALIGGSSPYVISPTFHSTRLPGSPASNSQGLLSSSQSVDSNPVAPISLQSAHSSIGSNPPPISPRRMFESNVDPSFEPVDVSQSSANHKSDTSQSEDDDVSDDVGEESSVKEYGGGSQSRKKSRDDSEDESEDKSDDNRESGKAGYMHHYKPKKIKPKVIIVKKITPLSTSTFTG